MAGCRNAARLVRQVAHRACACACGPLERSRYASNDACSSRLIRFRPAQATLHLSTIHEDSSHSRLFCPRHLCASLWISLGASVTDPARRGLATVVHYLINDPSHYPLRSENAFPDNGFRAYPRRLSGAGCRFVEACELYAVGVEKIVDNLWRLGCGPLRLPPAAHWSDFVQSWTRGSRRQACHRDPSRRRA